MASERRTCFAARVPKGDNFKKVSSYAVVEKISNSREVQPANYVGARCFNFGAYARFFNE